MTLWSNSIWATESECRIPRDTAIFQINKDNTQHMEWSRTMKLNVVHIRKPCIEFSLVTVKLPWVKLRTYYKGHYQFGNQSRFLLLLHANVLSISPAVLNLWDLGTAYKFCLSGTDHHWKLCHRKFPKLCVFILKRSLWSRTTRPMAADHWRSADHRLRTAALLYGLR